MMLSHIIACNHRRLLLTFDLDTVWVMIVLRLNVNTCHGIQVFQRAAHEAENSSSRSSGSSAFAQILYAFDNFPTLVTSINIRYISVAYRVDPSISYLSQWAAIIKKYFLPKSNLRKSKTHRISDKVNVNTHFKSLLIAADWR